MKFSANKKVKCKKGYCNYGRWSILEGSSSKGSFLEHMLYPQSVTKLEATRTTLGVTVVLFHDREPMALRMVKTWKWTFALDVEAWGLLYASHIKAKVKQVKLQLWNVKSPLLEVVYFYLGRLWGL